MTKRSFIQFNNFTFRYDSQREPTLYDINLTIYEGEKVLILGQSGSGKSTLMHCMNGLIPFSYKGEIQGECIIMDKPSTSLSLFKIGQQLGSILQDSDAQFVALSVAEDVAFVLENQNFTKPVMVEKVKEATSKVGMHDFLAQVPFQLSGGQKQKVALAGVLHDDVKGLLFDEPLASLDPQSAKAAIELIDELHESGKTMIIIEHRFEDVLIKPVDRVVVMHEGRIVFDGDVDTLLKTRLCLRYGLREPLYLQALSTFKVKLDTQKIWHPLHSLRFPSFTLPAITYEEVVNHEEEVLRLNHVSFQYDERPLIKDVSFSIRRGERIALMGENGAGKSTIAKLASGILRPLSGNIHVKDQDINGMSIAQIGLHIGYVMQNPNQMIVKQSVEEEILFALRLRHTDEAFIQERLLEVLIMTDLKSMRRWPVNALSYGQKKRLTVASILALSPDVLILDEPTAGQDYAHYTEIMSFLQSLHESTNLAFVFITHDMHLAMEYTDRALVFSKGSLIYDGPTYKALSNDALLNQASLRPTSLLELATLSGHDPATLALHFIKEFNHGQ
ncbi:MAG: ABC transporter ATP-binding protein [Erysipelothrix sp.]|jgi:energy-coupling factor transport system ATP-binding protein|nr:ABC transporter ATP-binding protein [Erysipelothrix sp.]